MKKKLTAIKKYIIKSPLITKIIVGAVIVLLLSLNFSWSCSKNNFSCNIGYDPPEIEQIKDVVK